MCREKLFWCFLRNPKTSPWNRHNRYIQGLRNSDDFCDDLHLVHESISLLSHGIHGDICLPNSIVYCGNHISATSHTLRLEVPGLFCFRICQSPCVFGTPDRLYDGSHAYWCLHSLPFTSSTMIILGKSLNPKSKQVTDAKSTVRRTSW